MNCNDGGRARGYRVQGEGLSSEISEGNLCGWHGWPHGGKVALPETLGLANLVSQYYQR